MKTKPPAKFLPLTLAVLISTLLLTSCTSTPKTAEDSPYYIQAPLQDIITEWMTYRNGTITTSGNAPYYYDLKQTSAVDPTSTDIRYDMPGTHCFLTEDDTESAYARLHVSTALQETPPIDLDQEIEKVATYWRSQGTTNIAYAVIGKHEKQISATTPHGTRLIYTIFYKEGRVLQGLYMKSLCAKEFGGNSTTYIGDLNERFKTTPTPSETP